MNTSQKQQILVIDTCVWINIARESRGEPIIAALQEMVESSTLRLYCPALVSEEFKRNTDRIVEANRQRLSHEFSRVRKAIDEVSTDDSKDSILQALEDARHRLPIFQDRIFDNVARVEQLISDADELVVSDEARLRAVDRAVEKRVPFHKNKNSIADALIIEGYFDLLRAEPDAVMHFITVNTKDFSSPSDHREPHEDFVEFAETKNAKYSIDLVETLTAIEPDVFEDAVFEHEWTMETRGLYEILEAIDEFVEKVWYDRHCMREEAIRSGQLKLVPPSESREYDSGVIHTDIWEGALRAAEATRKRYPDALGPYSDFEWGMLNGKLSALRWVLGDDWDMLDT